VNYVERHTEHQGASGDWLHDDGSPNCSISVENDKTCKVSPVMIPNNALCAELRKYDCDT
jgi:hypothetical protein